MRTDFWMILALPMVFGLARPAWAQPASDKSAEADVHFRQGGVLYQQQKFKEAEEELEKAFALKKSHDIAANLGYAEMRLGKPVEAAQHLLFAIKNWAPTGKDDKRRYAEQRLAQVKKEVVTLTINVNIAGADVLVDGVKVGTSPLGDDVFVTPGEHVVEVKFAGYRDEKQPVNLDKGKQLAIGFTMFEQAASEPEVQPVVSNQGAGANQGNQGAENQSGALIHQAPAQPAENKLRTPLLVAGGATAGALLIAGMVFTVVANGKAADRDQQMSWERCYEQSASTWPSSCAEADSLRRGAAAFGNAAVWSFAGAGALAAATVVYGFATRPSERVGVRVVPVVARHQGGVWVHGGF